MFTLATEPLDIGRTLDQGIKFYLGTFKQVIGLAFLACFCLYIPTVILQISTGGAEPTGKITIIGILLYLVMGIVYLALHIAVGLKMWGIANATDDEAIISRGFRLVPRIILLTILYGLAIMGGTLLLVIPGIYLSIALILSFYLILTDNLKATAALSASRHLIKGFWWRTMLIITIPSILIIAIFAAVGLFSGVGFAVASGTEDPGIMFTLIIDFFSTCIQALTMPLFYGILFVMLNDLKIRKEGSDLIQRVDAMK